MRTNLEIFEIGSAVKQARTSTHATVLRWECYEPLRFACLPGVFYQKGPEDFDAAEIARIPLMPWYCKVSVPPQTIGGRSYLSGIYIKSPVCIMQGDETLGFRFTPYLFGSKPVPLFFSFRRSGGKTEFELAVLREYVLRRRSKEQFETWSHHDRSFSEEVISLEDALDEWMSAGQIEHSLMRGETVGDVLEQVAAHGGAWGPPSQAGIEDDCRLHFNKSIRWLLGMYHPWARTYLSMRGRSTRVDVEGTIFPAYNTLASDFYRLSRYYPADERIACFSESACRLHVGRGAYVSLPGGALVFRNTARLSPNRRGVLFFDHFGVGLAGFPGGQATVVRSLAERWVEGDRSPGVRSVTEAAVRWLKMAQRQDGGWYRTYSAPAYLTPEDSAPPSPGACAEGTLALLKTYEAFGNREDLDAAERALNFINNKLADTMALTGYFRDCSAEETEAASGIFIAMANLQAFNTLQDREYLRAAGTALRYCLGWHRWWLDDGMDSIQHSFTPRIATCQTAWAAHAYYDYYLAAGDPFWEGVSQRSVRCLAYDNPYPGYGDGVYNDEDLRPYSVGFDCSYSASAILRFAMRVLQQEMEQGRLLPPDHACAFPKQIQPPDFRSDMLGLLYSVKSRIMDMVRSASL
jgi:hypothetical protein